MTKRTSPNGNTHAVYTNSVENPKGTFEKQLSEETEEGSLFFRRLSFLGKDWKKMARRKWVDAVLLNESRRSSLPTRCQAITFNLVVCRQTIIRGYNVCSCTQRTEFEETKVLDESVPFFPLRELGS